MRERELPRIVCYGDSNTFGYDGADPFGGRLPAETRWPELLGGLLGCETVNCGLNGRTVPYYERSVKADLALLRRQAPCTLVCPAKIDVARLILLYDRGQMAEAKALLSSKVDLCSLPCPTCKAGCEKACRRGRVDQSVSIRDIVKEVAASKVAPSMQTDSPSDAGQKFAGFSSKLGRYTQAETEWLKEVYSQPSRCLHCACEGQEKCRLREYATKADIKSSRYGISSRQPVKEQQHITGRLYYEPAKCVRCGLCVYNSEDGFTFQYRGFNMQVVIPEESKQHIDERLAQLCPTGALFLKD